MAFTGYYEHVIDEKNRLSIPAPLRAQIDPEGVQKKLYIVPGGRTGGLWIYREKDFNRLADSVPTHLIPNDDQLDFDRVFFTLAEMVEIDSAGRIVVPLRHIQNSGISREVTIAGVRDHIEIVSRAEFDRHKEEAWRNYQEIQRKARMNLQQDGRQPGGNAGGS